MKVRVQLIENNPLHRIPSIFLNIHKTQFIFNVIPTLVRHRKRHKINLYNSSYIFFTKNSIETIGGLPNFLLFRSGVQHSNSIVANKLNIFADNQVAHYLQKLRFKLGHKSLRTSFTNWQRNYYRYGISSYKLYNKIKNSTILPKIFSKMQDYLIKNAKQNEYYDSKYYISDKRTKYININASYYHSKLIDIYPVVLKQGQITITNYICILPEQKKGIDINLQKFISQSKITKQNQILKFCSGEYVHKNGKSYKRQNYLFQQDVKPTNILILHHINPQFVNSLINNPIFINYHSNKNETGLIVHIVEDLSITQTIIFKKLIQKFDKKTKHLWFNNKLNSISHLQVNLFQQNLIMQSIWSSYFPALIKNIQLQRLKYYNIEQTNSILRLFPEIKSYMYKRLFNFVKNQYLGDQYSLRHEVLPQQSRSSILTKHLQCIKQQISEINTEYIKFKKDLTQFQPKVIFLGTASSMPTIDRNTSGILVSSQQNHTILLDCGEQTLQQLINHYSPSEIQDQILKLKVIFITHIHSDHNLGILNLISERKKIMIKKQSHQKIFLIIPFNVFSWYKQYNLLIEDLSQCCDVIFTQVLINQSLQQSNQIQQETDRDKFKCDQTSDNYGAELEISARTSELVKSQLPNQGQVLIQFNKFLSQNSYLKFSPVRVIHCPQSFGIVIQNKNIKISYSGDTRPSKIFEEAAKNSSLMIHEATFNNQQSKKAQLYRHSTVQEAVNVGINSKSDRLILTHFNSEFKAPKAQGNQKQKQYFNNQTIISFDHLQVNINQTDNIPRLSKFICQNNKKVDEKYELAKEQIINKIKAKNI